MIVQVAGSRLTDSGSCGLTDGIVSAFIEVSALNTLSEPSLWFLTSVVDGGPVLERNNTVVPVGAVGRQVVAPSSSAAGSLTATALPVTAPALTPTPSQSPSTSASQSASATSTPVPSPAAILRVFNNSLELGLSAYVDSVAIELMVGPYIEFLRSRTILKVLRDRNVTEVEWIGWQVTPKKIRERSTASTTTTAIQTVPIGAGTVTAIVALGVMAAGLTTVIALEVSMSGAAVAAAMVSPV